MATSERVSLTMYHASKHRFDFPVYEQLLANQENHANGALGLWVSRKADWIRSFGGHIYEVHFSGRLYECTVSQLRSMSEHHSTQPFYIEKRQALLKEGFAYLQLQEHDGRSEMGVVLDFDAIESFREC